MTHAPDGPPANAPFQPRNPTGRLRLRALLAAIASLAAIGFASQVLVVDADPDSPRFRGITEANHFLSWAFAVAGLLWLASFLPWLSATTRVRALRVCLAILWGVAIAWIAWVLFRYATVAQ